MFLPQDYPLCIIFDNMNGSKRIRLCAEIMFELVFLYYDEVSLPFSRPVPPPSRTSLLPETKCPPWYKCEANDSANEHKFQGHVGTTCTIIHKIVLIPPPPSLLLRLLRPVMALMVEMWHIIAISALSLPCRKATRRIHGWV